MLPPSHHRPPPLLAFHLAFLAFFVASSSQDFITGHMVSSINATPINGPTTTCLTSGNGNPASPVAELQSMRKSRLRGWSTVSSKKESGVQIQTLSNKSTDSMLENKHLFKRRRLSNTECTDRDIGISQSREESIGGVPQFIVEIYTTCAYNCEPSDVHLNCEWFASKMVVNPSIFKRIAFNDCLVNGGQPIPRGHILHFTYENSFMYSLSFKSAKFC